MALRDTSNTTRPLVGSNAPPANKKTSGGEDESHQKPSSAAIRLQAVARGRTGRRKSMDIARERFGYLKKNQGVVKKATPSTNIPFSRTRRAHQPPAPAPAAPPPLQQETADEVVELATSVLERVGRCAVMAEVAEKCKTATELEVAKALEKGKCPPGQRWDLTAKIRARDEKLGEVRTATRKLASDRSRLEAFAVRVESLLLREIEREREKAAAAERALIDGTGMRERFDQLARERDEARDQKAAVEAELAGARATAEDLERMVEDRKAEVAEARTERDSAVAETSRLVEERARAAGGREGRVEATSAGAAAAARERDEARTSLEAARVEFAAERERLTAEVRAEKEALRRAVEERDQARSSLDEARSALTDKTARADRAEGAAQAAEKHYECVRDELRTREGDRRRLSELHKRGSAALEAAEMRAEASEAAFAAARDAKNQGEMLEKALEARDAALAQVVELRSSVEVSAARLEARADELRSRAEAAENARDRVAKEANVATAEKEAQRARADASERRAEEAEVAAEKAREVSEQAAEQARSARTEADAATKQLAVEACLRNAAQAKEESERRECTAALAQLLALRESITTERSESAAAAALAADELAALQASWNAASVLAARRLSESEELAAEKEAELEELRQQLVSATESKEAALELSKKKGELEALRHRLADAERETQRTESESRDRVVELEEKLARAEATRRKLHNLVQELKGNIRVFARVRPGLPSDQDEENSTLSPISASADGRSLTLATVAQSEDGPFAKARTPKPSNFSFDKVFPASTGQDEVFDEVSDVIQSALDGYQVCLFAYGQTGSGKTHTMCGSGRGQMRGIIPRALEQVAAYLKSQRERGWTYQLTVTYLEVYNETVRDLLVPDDASPEEVKKASNLELRRDPKTGLVVAESATAVPVSLDDLDKEDDEIERLMAVAAKHRCVAATDMNAVSSRSHAVFCLHVHGSNDQTIIKGALNLVDLAGSERLNRSGAVGERAKEAAHINKSLSALAGVFSALASKKPHVPYRDSKLTFLLQNGLSGKTLLIVNLSPTSASANESLSTLKFAQQAARVELGRATRTIVDSTPRA